PRNHEQRGNLHVDDGVGEADLQRVAHAGLEIDQHWNDRRQVGQTRALPRALAHARERDRQRHTLPVEHDGQLNRDGFRLELHAKRELEAEVIVAVDDDPFVLDLLERQRPRLDRGDEDLLDDFQRYARRRDVEHRAPARREADVADRVVAGSRQRGETKQQRIGAEWLAGDARAERDAARQARARELSVDLDVGAEEAREIGGRDRTGAAFDEHADTRCRVLGNRRRQRIRRRSQAEHGKLELADFANRRLRASGRRHTDELGGTERGDEQTADRFHLYRPLRSPRAFYT